MPTNPPPGTDPGAGFDWTAAEADLSTPAVDPASGADTGPDARPATTAVDGWPGRLLRRLTPPEPWRHRPISAAALWRYATRGAWAAKPDGPARRIGQLYTLLVALPATVVAHYLAWIVARPSRLVVAAGLYLLLAHVGPMAPYIP